MANQDMINMARENVEAYNGNDWPRLKAVLAHDCVYDEVGSQRCVKGPDEMVQAYQAWKRAFPDGKGTVTNSFFDGNRVALEVTWEGTHQAPLIAPEGSIPALGRHMEVRAVQVATFEHDKIKEFRQYFDLGTILDQIRPASDRPIEDKVLAGAKPA